MENALSPPQMVYALTVVDVMATNENSCPAQLVNRSEKAVYRVSLAVPEMSLPVCIAEAPEITAEVSPKSPIVAPCQSDFTYVYFEHNLR